MSLKSFWNWLTSFWRAGAKHPPTPGPTLPTLPPPAPPTPASASTCGCDLSKPLLDPPQGIECPVPWGKDVRFRCWSPSRGDTVFISQPDNVTYSDGRITAQCNPARGYHYLGYRCPSSSSPLCKDATGIYRETYRLDYEYRGTVQ